ncbi:MAG TPA: toprim domain-containing protein [Prolixibacteraceae bacterium]|nr:toprim domain-containing protein [Prolixibacteraceae bacterium]
MKSIEANAISIKQYLSENGIQPAKDRGYYGMYHSPFREDHNASLKVDYNQNVWHDFGSGEGGGLIDLVMRMENCSFHEAISKLEQKYSHADIGTYQSANIPTSNFSFHRKNVDSDLKSPESAITLQNVQPISNSALIEYLHERRIGIGIVRIHCSEVHYSVNNKPYYAVGFQNDKGGYELRSKYFKACTSKDITSVKRNKNHCVLFEGFMDYLSFLTIQKQQNAQVDVIVLNSLTNLPKVKSKLTAYKGIWTFFDNDVAGKKAVQELQSTCNNVNDLSYFYSGYKDLNEYLCHKQQIKQAQKLKRSGMKR